MLCVDGSAKEVDTGSPRSESRSKASPRKQGSGFAGTWIPADDFISQIRKTRWVASPKNRSQVAPPRVYLDHKTLIREVLDLTSLRHGDHCLTSLNPVRIVSPTLDYVISLLGSYEFVYFFHHFIMCDDVDHLDAQGVPRTADGKIVQMVEFSNTPAEAIAEVFSLCKGNPLWLPSALLQFFRNIASCLQRPLADYGDIPHIYKVVEQQSPEDRDRIKQAAIAMTKDHQPYTFFSNNCEHTAYAIHTGEKHSFNVEYFYWSLFRWGLCGVGLFFLNAGVAACYNTFCLRYPVWALVGYHCLTSVPVVLQAMITYMMLSKSVWQQYCMNVIDKDDCYHVLAKELGRAIVVGGLTILTITLMPKMIQDTQCFTTACLLCLFAYFSADMLYNALAHFVMRCILLPVFGRVWLIGRSTKRDADRQGASMIQRDAGGTQRPAAGRSRTQRDAAGRKRGSGGRHG